MTNDTTGCSIDIDENQYDFIYLNQDTFLRVNVSGVALNVARIEGRERPRSLLSEAHQKAPDRTIFLNSTTNTRRATLRTLDLAHAGYIHMLHPL